MPKLRVIKKWSLMRLRSLLAVGSNDVVPQYPLSIVLSLSDKIDYLTCLWKIGIRPTGNKDPFALRRTALGIIRII